MSALPIDGETDPVRQAILAAMNRLLAGTPQRSNGRLNISQLAIEAGVHRWRLTHQHLDLKKLFEDKVARDEAQRRTRRGSADAYADLQHKHGELQAHCRFLEARLQLYATALNLLSLELTAISDRDVGTAKVMPLPRHRQRTP